MKTRTSKLWAAVLGWLLTSALLTACGGGGSGGGAPAPKFEVSVTVTGLAGTGLVVSLNGTTDLAITGNGAATFNITVPNGTAYDVQVKTYPSAPTQLCTITGGTGVISGADIVASMTCQDAYLIGGMVSGLAGSGLVLQNNGGDDLVISVDGVFTFATPLLDAASYAVTVFAQPSNLSQTCTVNNGSGNVSSADVTNMTVTCVTDTFSIGGTVTGLNGSGLTLQNNGGDNLVIGASGAFSFPTDIDDGSAYDVTILAQPTNLSQTCAVASGSGTLVGADVTDVTITCVTDTFSIGGTVSGLAAGNSVTLQNNGEDDIVISADGAFAFSSLLLDGTGYAATVLTQPTIPNQTCVISNGTGTLAGSDVTDVAVTCTTNTYTVGGTVSGLTPGNGVTLRNNGEDDLLVAANGSFTFSTPLDDESAYSVTVLAQPTTPSQACVVTSGSGSLAGGDITNVSIACTTNQYTVGGTVTGLAGSGLVLQNNGGDDETITVNGAFTFNMALDDESGYAVTVLSQPTNLSQTCSASNGSGTLAGSNVTNVSITCVTNTFTIGGTVSGLNGTGLTLQDNGGDDEIITADGPFTFTTALADGSTYDVTISVQPVALSQTCSVTNGSGTLAGANVTDVSITCVTNTFTVGGTVSGLAGTGLTLQNNGGDDELIMADGAFTFNTPLEDGTGYHATVLVQPTSPAQYCAITAEQGIVDSAAVTTLEVNCRFAQIWYVDIDNASGVEDGNSWITAFTSIAQAESVVAAGDQVWIAEGTYKASSPNAPVLSMVEYTEWYGGFIGDELTIGGRLTPRPPTILSGDYDDNFIPSSTDSYHVVIGDSYSILDGFIVEYGYASGLSGNNYLGGGMLNIDVYDLTLSGITFRMNTASYGGAVYNNNSIVDISDTDFAYNVASRNGGALHISGGGTTAISTSRFDANEAVYVGTGQYGDGGAINSWGGTLVVIDSSFASNIASGTDLSNFSSGGAIHYLSFDVSDKLVIADSEFRSNSSTFSGGALDLYHSGEVVILNTLFIGNKAEPMPGASGGAINFLGSGSRTITNSTFTYNGAFQDGGAIAVGGASGTLNIVNSIFFGNNNTFPNCCWDDITGSLAQISYSCVEDSTFSGNNNVILVTSPFVQLDGNEDGIADYYLLKHAGLDGNVVDSPCVGVGNIAAADDPVVGFPAYAMEWRNMTTRSDRAPDPVSLDIGRYYEPLVVDTTPTGSIDIPSSDTTIRTGETVTLTASCTDLNDDTPFGHFWDLGGGAPDQMIEDPGDIVFSAPGIYTVTYTCTDAHGLVDPTPPSVIVYVGDGIWRVKPSGAGAMNGTSWENAFANIQDALDAAATGDMVWVTEGTFKAAVGNAAVITMKEGVDIYGGFLGIEIDIGERSFPLLVTTLSGDTNSSGTKNAGDADHVVIAANNSRLDGFIVSGGYADGASFDGAGAGVYANGIQDFVIANTTITNNRATSDCGGGLYVLNGDNIDIVDTSFVSNWAFNCGGALANINAVSGIDLRNVKFVGNTAFANDTTLGGGAIYDAFGANSYFVNVDFYNNLSTFGRGGALYARNTSPRIVNAAFDGNSGDLGGAVYDLTASPNLVNVSFRNNTAAGSGGGIHNYNGSISTLANAVFFGNAGTGPDIYNNTIAGTANAVVVNSCAQQNFSSFGVNNLMIAVDPFVASDVRGTGNWDAMSPDGTDEIYLVETSACMDAGDDAKADDASTGFSAFGLDWRNMTTRTDGMLDLSPVDLGRHYEP